MQASETLSAQHEHFNAVPIIPSAPMLLSMML